MKGKFGNGGRAVWAFLDGKKLFIWTGVIALKHMFPNLPIWGFVDAAAGAVGWKDLTPLIDPDQLVTWVTLGIAIGHKLHKAWGGDVEVEWKTIGEVPEVKVLPKEQAVEVQPIASPVTEHLVDFKSKAVIPVGTKIPLASGWGVVIYTKETSGTGYTYAVRQVQ